MRWEGEIWDDVRSMDVRNWKKVAQNRDRWKVVERAIGCSALEEEEEEEK
jgi:hypothetical protein